MVLKEKMGYKRGTGLGPKGQGRVQPIEGLMTKPLPAGLSLDYVNEFLNKPSTKYVEQSNIGKVYSNI